MKTNTTVFNLPKRKLLFVLILFGAFSAYHTYTGYTAATAQATFSNSDQTNIGLMVLKVSDPALFGRDYVFKDTTLFEFYTPAFISLASLLTRLTGSYDLALVAMLPFIMMIYLGGMFFLIYYITGNVFVAVLVSILSSFMRLSIAATFWGVTGLGTVMPRTVFLMFVPWLFLCWLLWLEDKSWWKLPLLAFLIGLLTNLHPVSGFVFLQLLMSLALFEYGLSRQSIARLLAASVTALIGVWPTLINFLRHTNPAAVREAPTTFPVFYGVMHERLLTLFPFPPELLNFFGHPVTAGEQVVIVWLYVTCMLVWLAAFYLFRQGIIKPGSSTLFFVALLLLQLPLAFLLIRFTEPALFVFAVLYAVLRFTAGPDKWDRHLLIFMTLVICYSFIAAYGLEVIWRRFELWSLTPLVAEQSRMAGFVYLPFYVFLARLLASLDIDLPASWEKQGLLVSLGLLTLLPDPNMALVVAAFCLAILMKLRFAHALKRYKWLEILIEATVLALTLNVIFAIFSIEKWPIVWAQAKPALPEEEQDTLELYQWAKAETNVDSLFYYDSLDFRFRAERSISHSWKDLGLAYYSRALLVPFYERYRKLQGAYEAEEEELVLSYAAEYKVDYIVVEEAVTLSLDLPAVFANGSYVVYQREE